jgi:DNA-binding NtrC family response regulator
MSNGEPANGVSDSPTNRAEPPGESAQLRRRVLIADDNEDTCVSLQKLLEVALPVRVDTVADGSQALKALTEQPYSILITDLKMPHVSGMQLIQEMQDRRLPVTVVVTTGHGSIDAVVQAMQLGAYNFLTKPPDPNHLCLVIQRALRERTLLDEVTCLREQLQNRYSFHNILTKNPKMLAIFELIGHVARRPTTVLIEGETGTGKEQVARAIHEASPQSTGPLVAINCAAVPETLLESELFGHEKGAFTNALGQRKGRFELAHGGTLLLDEVGDVPLPMQAKLLRVLQERCFERVGGTETVEVDVRVIAATNRSLQDLVKQGKFREDLFYRLNVVKIDLPPLRERAEDVPLLAAHFAQRYCRGGAHPKQIAPEAMEALLRYRWPGNVRELENAIERACVTSHDEWIRAESLPPAILKPPRPKMSFPIDLSRPLTEQLPEVIAIFEARYLRRALKKARGHIGRAARITGLSRRTVSTKILQYKIDKSEYMHE